MPTKKIDRSEVEAWAAATAPACRDSDHQPAQYIVLEPGLYQHDCPGCGASTIFRVDQRARMG